jgi:hypothetical protein
MRSFWARRMSIGRRKRKPPDGSTSGPWSKWELLSWRTELVALVASQLIDEQLRGPNPDLVLISNLERLEVQMREIRCNSLDELRDSLRPGAWELVDRYIRLRAEGFDDEELRAELRHGLPDCLGGAYVPEVVVHVAEWLGAGALGGIIGNRADAALVRTVRGLFTSVRERWRTRTSNDSAPLTQKEAIDIVRAAAIALEYREDSIVVRSATAMPLYRTQSPAETCRWVIYVEAQISGSSSPEVLRATVPSGDPAEAAILIIPKGRI